MLCRKFCWRHVIQRAMWSLLVVVLTPRSNQDTSLRQTRKPLVIETFVPEASVKAFDKSILCGFACLNQLDLHAMHASPLIQGFTREFRALICADGFGVTPGSEPPDQECV